MLKGKIIAAAALGVMTVALASPVLADGDAAAGKKVFNKCKACHTIDDGGKNRVGPNLFGIFGRTSGTHDGFKYSSAMKDAAIVWDDDQITKYLTKPRDFMPGNKMAFPGLRKPEQIVNLLAFLHENAE